MLFAVARYKSYSTRESKYFSRTQSRGVNMPVQLFHAEYLGSTIYHPRIVRVQSRYYSILDMVVEPCSIFLGKDVTHSLLPPSKVRKA